MSQRDQQKGYLASIAQAFDVGDFDYLSPEELQSLDSLIANAWKSFGQGKDANSEISEIEKALGHQPIVETSHSTSNE
ncbi:hypothetical protein [Egbenema bharatensis]|uniref:hypothetical protein n=1 Tax=Egbenema bharatensis TaxID=3463334 RepID=UPI003A88C0E1